MGAAGNKTGVADAERAPEPENGDGEVAPRGASDASHGAAHRAGPIGPWWRRGIDRLERVAGGPARARAILLLGATLALDSADKGAVGAAAAPIRQALHISNFELGLLVSTVSLAGGLGTIPFGWLTDRVNRTRLLAGAIVAWGVAMIFVGASSSFTMLILTRVGLGVVVAAAGPTIASLVGDLFPGRERARIFGMILVGEFVGAGIGVVFSGELAAIWWRLAFWIFVLPAFALAWFMWRFPEPSRGQQAVLLPGAVDPREAQKDFGISREARRRDEEQAGDREPGAAEETKDMALEQGFDVREDLVLHGTEPQDMSLWAAVRYVLRIPTNVLLITASSMGYFFFTALRTFGVVYVRKHFGVSQAEAGPLVLIIGIGAIAGLVAGGWFADRWLGQGRLNARVVLVAILYVGAALIIVPGIVLPALWVALGLFVVGAFALAAANAPLDAARLDVMHHRLWGRAESVRYVLRTGAEAIAPLIFGLLADHLAGGGGSGMMWAFLIFLIPLAANGAILIPVFHTYPRDVATAGRSEQETRGSSEE